MTKYQISKQEKRIVTLEKSGEYVVELVGEGAEVEVVGRFRIGGGITKSTKNNKESTKKITPAGDNCEIKVTIVHKAGHTRARTSLKGVVVGKGRLKFDGKIIVEKNCPDVNSFLEERVLLVGDEARAEVVPDLEILSDDVKCSHAATISKIPEEQVFYLMSRGISRQEAEGLVVEGFLV